MKKIKKNNIPIFLLINVVLSVYSDFLLDDNIRARIIESESFKTTRRPDDAYEQKAWQGGLDVLTDIPLIGRERNLGHVLLRNDTARV